MFMGCWQKIQDCCITNNFGTHVTGNSRRTCMCMLLSLIPSLMQQHSTVPRCSVQGLNQCWRTLLDCLYRKQWISSVHMAKETCVFQSSLLKAAQRNGLDQRQMFGKAFQTLFGIPTSQMGVPGFKFWFYLLLARNLGSKSWWSKYFSPWYPQCVLGS